MSTAIATVRVRATGDPGALRVRLERSLAGANLRPATLPPAAILVVRVLPDPLPGALGRHDAEPAWHRAAEARLEVLAASAARPALASVPAGASAVRFEDEAELLACLAGDALRGGLAERWWWRRWSPRGSVAAIWESSPRAAPAALALLARWRLAQPFAVSLSEAEAGRLTCAIAAAWDVEPVLAVQSRFAEPSPVAEPEPEPPWRDLEPAGVRLDPGRRRLVGLSLTLALRPARARERNFARTARTWYAAATSMPTAAPVAAEEPERADPPGRADQPGPPVGGVAPDDRRVHPTDVADMTRAGPRAAAAAAAAGRAAPAPAARVPAESAPAPRRPPGPPETPADHPPAAVRPGVATLEPVAPPQPAARHARLERAPAPGEWASWAGTREGPTGAGVPTALGGLFYLVNVGLFLGLYGDFTTPRSSGLALSPWDFVDALGRRLLDPRPADADDAVWAVLASLAGREPGERAGRGFRAPRPDPLVALERELGLPPRRARWLDRLAQVVRRRLALALAAGEADGAALVLRAPARVHVTATRVDVVLGLAELPLAVRRAGLDRDPGWVPAAGRTIVFHFA